MVLSGYKYLERLDYKIKSAIAHMIYNLQRVSYAYKQQSNVAVSSSLAVCYEKQNWCIINNYCNGNTPENCANYALIVWRNNTGKSLKVKIGDGNNWSVFSGEFSSVSIRAFIAKGTVDQNGNLSISTYEPIDVPPFPAESTMTINDGEYFILESLCVTGTLTKSTASIVSIDRILEIWLFDPDTGDQYLGIAVDVKLYENIVDGPDYEVSKSYTLEPGEAISDYIQQLNINSPTIASAHNYMIIKYEWVQGDETYFKHDTTQGLLLRVEFYDNNDTLLTSYELNLGSCTDPPCLAGGVDIPSNAAYVKYHIYGVAQKSGVVEVKIYTYLRSEWYE